MGTGLEAGLGVSAGLFAAHTNANCVGQLKGPGYSIGAGGGTGPSVGVDRIGGDGYSGWSGNAGASWGPVPGEAHAIVTNTY